MNSGCLFLEGATFAILNIRDDYLCANIVQEVSKSYITLIWHNQWIELVNWKEEKKLIAGEIKTKFTRIEARKESQASTEQIQLVRENNRNL